MMVLSLSSRVLRVHRYQPRFFRWLQARWTPPAAPQSAGLPLLRRTARSIPRLAAHGRTVFGGRRAGGGLRGTERSATYPALASTSGWIMVLAMVLVMRGGLRSGRRRGAN